MISIQLAGEDDVLAVTELLRLHFAESNDDEIGSTILTRQAVEDALKVMHAFDQGGDIGVGAFYNKTTEELWKLLDFPQGRPVLWNRYRAKDSAVTAWDAGENDISRLEFQAGGARMNPNPITLFPHQMQAIASVVKMMFSKDRKEDKGGVLIADGVGAGFWIPVLVRRPLPLTGWSAVQYVSFSVNMYGERIAPQSSSFRRPGYPSRCASAP